MEFRFYNPLLKNSQDRWKENDNGLRPIIRLTTKRINAQSVEKVIYISYFHTMKILMNGSPFDRLRLSQDG